jgi:flagellar biosynthesis/type III secretory pathway protein FliH
MNFHLIAATPGAALLLDQPVIRREDVATVQGAAELIALAETRLADVDAYRAAQAEAGRTEGFRIGCEEGRALAAREAAETVARLHAEMQHVREQLRAATGKLALDVVRRIAVELGPEATLAALAERAVRDVLPDAPITVHVAPASVGAVTTRLWPIGAAIEVQPDETLAPGDCIIETAAGRSHAGLEVQLAALERVFERDQAA